MPQFIKTNLSQSLEIVEEKENYMKLNYLMDELTTNGSSEVDKAETDRIVITVQDKLKEFFDRVRSAGIEFDIKPESERYKMLDDEMEIYTGNVVVQLKSDASANFADVVPEEIEAEEGESEEDDDGKEIVVDADDLDELSLDEEEREEEESEEESEDEEEPEERPIEEIAPRPAAEINGIPLMQAEIPLAPLDTAKLTKVEINKSDFDHLKFTMKPELMLKLVLSSEDMMKLSPDDIVLEIKAFTGKELRDTITGDKLFQLAEALEKIDGIPRKMEALVTNSEIYIVINLVKKDGK